MLERLRQTKLPAVEAMCLQLAQSLHLRLTRRVEPAEFRLHVRVGSLQRHPERRRNRSILGASDPQLERAVGANAPHGFFTGRPIARSAVARV